MFYDGKTYDATIVGVEEENDVAVLKIDATGLTPLKWATVKAFRSAKRSTPSAIPSVSSHSP